MSTAAAAFRKRGWSSKPTGSVSRTDETATTSIPGPAASASSARPQRLAALAEVRSEPDVGAHHGAIVPDSVRRLAVVALLVGLAAAAAAPAGATSLLLSDHALVALTDDSAAGLVRARGGERVSAPLRLWRLDTAAALELVPELRARGAFRYAEPDLVRAAAVLPSDPLSTPEIGYHLYRIGADRAEPPPAGYPLTSSTPGSTSRTRSSRTGRTRSRSTSSRSGTRRG